MPQCSVSWNSLLDAVSTRASETLLHHVQSAFYIYPHVATCLILTHASTLTIRYPPPTNAIGKDTRPGKPSLVDANGPMFICTTGFDYNGGDGDSGGDGGGDGSTITLHDPACTAGQLPTAVTLHSNTAPTKRPSAQLYNSSSN